MNILFDGNYAFHKCFGVFSQYYKGQDMSDVLSDPEKQQVLLRKCIIDMCAVIKRFKEVKRVAFVIDSSSWRYSLYDDYKYALTRVRDPFYKHFLNVLYMFEDLLRNKGIIVSKVMGAEGDDLLYIWAIYFGYILDEDLVIITGDSDIRQIMNKNVSLFDNNSKNLKMYCIPEKEVFWNEYLDTDVQIIPAKPFEVLLYKVILGDTSDNIPKLKAGFGPKTFEKFIESITPYQEPINIDLIPMAQWISTRFSEFSKINEDELLGKIIFNLKMTWLNLSVYNNTDYQTENGKSLLENMLDDVNNQKEKYSYNKKYTLEEFYNLPIK
jgi:5'-3' exonuclease